MPIRKGDGTALAPKGFQEVRKGDGTILYSGGPTLIDSIEDGDMAEYTMYATNFAASTAKAVDGSYSARVELDASNPRAYSTSGLNAYPVAGDTFRWHTQSEAIGSSNLGFEFGLQNAADGSSDRYSARFRGRSGDMALIKVSGGSATTLASAAQSYTSNIWYEGEVAWGTDGTITFTAFDDTGAQINQISATDTTFTSGGIGWVASSGTNDSTTYTYHDYARIL